MSLHELNKPHQEWREQGVGKISISLDSFTYVPSSNRDFNPVVYILGNYKSGKLRAFRQDGGYWTVINRRLVWEKPRVQMVYNVFSAHGEAYVTVEATRSGFNETIEFICIDVSIPFLHHIFMYPLHSRFYDF